MTRQSRRQRRIHRHLPVLLSDARRKKLIGAKRRYSPKLLLEKLSSQGEQFDLALATGYMGVLSDMLLYLDTSRRTMVCPVCQSALKYHRETIQINDLYSVARDAYYCSNLDCDFGLGDLPEKGGLR